MIDDTYQFADNDIWDAAMLTTLSPHKYFHIFRRFEHLRVRLLLAKQDKLSILEKRLNKIDREEPAPVFLSSMKMNGSPERAAIISEIEDALQSYGTGFSNHVAVLC
ncbi:hypothetical protein FMUND_13090 [Fusarium mundagurra]|uniref:DUF6594 domain-containing protein n=1 Tax=Fusarium mundagurra TaxID=1567541 RepID=A0A8H6D4F7_9HYPO|nr:hypothetical protein FMUND_13090 [Fusarium mundagurra]